MHRFLHCCLGNGIKSLISERDQLTRKTDGLRFLECTIKSPIPHKWTPTEMKLYEMGLAPKPNKAALDSGKPFCESYAVIMIN